SCQDHSSMELLKLVPFNMSFFSSRRVVQVAVKICISISACRVVALTKTGNGNHRSSAAFLCQSICPKSGQSIKARTETRSFPKEKVANGKVLSLRAYLQFASDLRWYVPQLALRPRGTPAESF